MTRKRTALSTTLTPHERELLTLRRRWLAIQGEDMPAEYLGLPIDRIRWAVDQVAAGNEVFVPREPVRRPVECGEAGSMREWDSESDG